MVQAMRTPLNAAMNPESERGAHGPIRRLGGHDVVYVRRDVSPGEPSHQHLAPAMAGAINEEWESRCVYLNAESACGRRINCSAGGGVPLCFLNPCSLSTSPADNWSRRIRIRR